MYKPNGPFVILKPNTNQSTSLLSPSPPIPLAHYNPKPKIHFVLLIKRDGSNPLVNSPILSSPPKHPAPNTPCYSNIYVPPSTTSATLYLNQSQPPKHHHYHPSPPTQKPLQLVPKGIQGSGWRMQFNPMVGWYPRGQGHRQSTKAQKKTKAWFKFLFYFLVFIRNNCKPVKACSF